MNPTVLLLLQILTQLFSNCPQPPTPAELRKPKRGHDLLLFVKAVRAGVSLADYRAARATLQEIADESTDAELEALVAA